MDAAQKQQFQILVGIMASEIRAKFGPETEIMGTGRIELDGQGEILSLPIRITYQFLNPVTGKTVTTMEVIEGWS